jgi:hypothetical protein
MPSASPATSSPLSASYTEMLPGVWPGVVTICRSKTRSPSSTGKSGRGTLIAEMSSAPAYAAISGAASMISAALPT